MVSSEVSDSVSSLPLPDLANGRGQNVSFSSGQRVSVYALGGNNLPPTVLPVGYPTTYPTVSLTFGAFSFYELSIALPLPLI